MTLADYLKREGLTLEAFARSVGVTKGRISQIQSGANCSPDLALKIERITAGEVSASELCSIIASAREPQSSAA